MKREQLTRIGTALLSWGAFMAILVPIAYSQEPAPIESAPTQPAPEQQPPTMTPTESEPTNSQPVEPVPASQGIDLECRKALETLCVGVQPGGGRLRKCYEDKESTLTPACRQQVQMNKSEAAAILGAFLGTAAQAAPETIIEHKQVRPSETYVAGFGGYTFGGGFSGVEGAGFLSGLQGTDRDLADSVVYGGKVGHFFGDRMDWLGLEMEAYNTTPHVKQDGQLPGVHQRVTTLAFNVVGRLKFGCETKPVRTETRTERDAKVNREIRYETHYERDFCRLQPYGGVGLGVFFAELSNNGSSASDNAVPGFNALAGLRYFVSERIALFGEYKYNFAAFDFTGNVLGGAAGIKADYHINHFVGGLSLHF